MPTSGKQYTEFLYITKLNKMVQKLMMFLMKLLVLRLKKIFYYQKMLQNCSEPSLHPDDIFDYIFIA